MGAERAYADVCDLVKRLGGSMVFEPGGGPGGVWTISLHGVTKRVKCRDRSVNDLDMLYIARADVPVPRTWDDYEHPYQLQPDAFWKLIDLLRPQAPLRLDAGGDR